MPRLRDEPITHTLAMTEIEAEAVRYALQSLINGGALSLRRHGATERAMRKIKPED